ncbi:MAG: sulfate ABC transporter permease subunit CysT, partial [Rhizorhabdus sp.]
MGRPAMRILPGFSLTMGLTITWLSLIVLIPLSAVFIRSFGQGFDHFLSVAFSERALASYRVTFGAAAIAALVNAVFGLLIAWVLVRYKFPGRQLLSAVIDLPFALPTAVAGIALTAIYADTGWLGKPLADLGIAVAYKPQGIVIAMAFIGLPFVVRTVEPVLADIDQTTEEAAACLGATRFATFRRIILPAILPALLTGFALAFARAVGEYGSVIFIAGNLPNISEIAPVLIVIKLEEFDQAGAAVIAAMTAAPAWSNSSSLMTISTGAISEMFGRL